MFVAMGPTGKLKVTRIIRDKPWKVHVESVESYTRNKILPFLSINVATKLSLIKMKISSRTTAMSENSERPGLRLNCEGS